jgi:hypothetical protein
MPNVNWRDAEKRETIQDGKYLCRVKQIILKTTQTQKDMWTLHLSIEDEGDCYGKILFHNLVFGPTSLWQVRLFYEAALGEKMEGEHNCQTSDLLDHFVIVTVKGKNDFGPILTYFENPSKRGEPTAYPKPKAPEGQGEADDGEIPF